MVSRDIFNWIQHYDKIDESLCLLIKHYLSIRSSRHGHEKIGGEGLQKIEHDEPMKYLFKYLFKYLLSSERSVCEVILDSLVMMNGLWLKEFLVEIVSCFRTP